MRTDCMVERFSQSFASFKLKRCCICSKMVYFKAYRCKNCKYLMHQSCFNSKVHLCQSDKNVYNKLYTTNSVYDTIGSTSKNSTLSQNSLYQDLTYWTETNYDKYNKFVLPDGHHYSENLVYEQLPKKDEQSFDLNENHYNNDNNNNTLKQANLDNNCDNCLIDCVQEGNFIQNLNSFKNWWHKRTSRKQCIKANLEDKHVKSRFSLTCDEKLTRKYLENYLKKNKRMAKAHFDLNTNENLNNSPSYSYLDNFHQFIYQKKFLNQKQSNSNYLETNTINKEQVQNNSIYSLNPFNFNETQSNSENTYQQQMHQAQNLISFQLKLIELNKQSNLYLPDQTDSNSFSYDNNYNLSLKFDNLIKTKTNLKKNLQKLFRNSTSSSIQENPKQLLTKARTLSMETKTAEYQSFLATWPTSDTIISKIEDFLEPEEDFSLIKNNLNEDIEEVIKEWCIPFQDIRFDTLLRRSRKGEIYRGHWHGDVLIYTFDKLISHNEETMNKFKKDIAQLTKIRHENIMLFMGACIEQDNLSVITSMQKGSSLSECIHKKRQNLLFSSKINILRQVAQAMGYLHARGIIHKKISSNNIILENKVKICIMDQGFNTFDYKSDNYSIVAKGHLTYLSPELIRSFRIKQTPNYLISEQYTNESDIYAFGTLIYELLNIKYPFCKLQNEQIIWAIGNGKHESVESIKCDPTLKSLLSQCWSPIAEKRPQFSFIVKKLQENVSLNKRHSSSEPERLNKLVGLSRII